MTAADEVCDEVRAEVHDEVPHDPRRFPAGQRGMGPDGADRDGRPGR
ncbi:hypothetical protein ACIPWI_07200 [Streptomyces sp. NPDC090046]